MVSKSGRTTDFSKDEKLLMAASRRHFQRTRFAKKKTSGGKASDVEVIPKKEANITKKDGKEG